MADTRQVRWRVEVELSGTLGIETHEELARLGMSTLCLDGIDRITHFSAARHPASAALAVQNWINPKTLNGLEIVRVEIYDAARWEEMQPPMSEQEQLLLSKADR